jgi:PAS domain-containing protein
MTTHRLSPWLRALLQPAPILGMAMIAVLWIGLVYLLADHHGTLAEPQAREPIFLPMVVLLTLLELITMAASIRRQLSLEQTNVRFDTALENMTHGLCMFDRDKRLVICN